jgi:hypothetical protein
MKSDPYMTIFEAIQIRSFWSTFSILKNEAYEITLLSVCLCPPTSAWKPE